MAIENINESKSQLFENINKIGKIQLERKKSEIKSEMN